MNRPNANKIILAIESAIEGGSLSLIKDGVQLDERHGAAGVSRAEDLLVDIDGLLRANHLAPADLDIVAASAGPGSFTGIRIGIATALGLARGTGARYASASLLRACAARYLADSEEGVVVLPVGRGSVAIQKFRATSDGIDELTKPEIVPSDDLNGTPILDGSQRILLHHSLTEQLSVGKVRVIGRSLAFAIGIRCGVDPIVTEPLFLSKS